MRSFTLIALASLAMAVPAVAKAQPSGGQIGVRLLVQPWTPVTDDETVHRVEHPDMISTALAEAWRASKPDLTAQIVEHLSRPDIAPGFTLREIVLSLPDPQLTVQRISGGGNQPLRLRVDLRLPGGQVEATSTQPTPLGAFADPRCRARIDLTASMLLSVGQGTTTLLSAERLPGEPVIRADNFDWAGENAVCAAFKAAVAGFGFDGIVKRLVTDSVARSPAGDALVTKLQQFLVSANGQLAAALPGGLPRREAWFVERSGAQLLALYFAPVTPMPDAGPPATITGTLRILPARGVVGAGIQQPAVDCASLPVAAERKAGPRPVLNAFGALGEAPMEELRLTTSCTRAPDGSLQHSIGGLSSTFPNILRSTGLSHGCRPGQTWKSGLVLMLPGRNNQRILPSELSARFDIDVAPLSSPCALQFIEERDPRRREPLDRDTAWRSFEEITRGRMTLDRSLGEVLGRFGGLEIGMDPVSGGTAIGGFAEGGGLVSLNPQPLPPEPPDRLRVLEDLVRVQQEQIQLQQRQFRLQQELMRVR